MQYICELYMKFMYHANYRIYAKLDSRLRVIFKMLLWTSSYEV